MRSESRTPPTVIVSRRFRRGASDAGRRWLTRLAEAAAESTGFVDSTTQPPGEQHPDDWVIVYRFESDRALRAWLDSDRRRELLDEGADLLDGPEREQVVALADEQASVTAVATFRIRDGAEREFLQRYRELQSALVGFDGFVRSELVEPRGPNTDETAIVFTFLDRERLDRWLESDERAALLRDIDPLLDGDRTVNVVGGFAGWFSPPSSAPKRWKQAALVLLALYPTSLAIGAARQAIAPDFDGPAAVLVTNVVGVAVLSWLLMPFLTRTFDRWLRS